MDKLKAFLAVMKKQHFWVMCGVVLILGLSGWAWATSNLAGQYRANRTKIEGIYKDLDQLRSADRENPEWIKGAEVETRKLRIKVKGAWEDVYAEQRDKVLRWPKVLGEDFLRIVPQLPPSEEIPVDQRERYWNYAKEEFPRLLEIIDARHYADKSDDVVPGLDQRGGRGGKGGPLGGKARPKDDPDAPPPHDYKVYWNKEDQQAIENRLQWSNTPTTQEVRQTQEDLWVYQALLTIIKHLNERADGHHNAKVKEILALLIGRDAALRFQAGMAEGRIEHPEVAGALAGVPGGAPPGGPAGAGKSKAMTAQMPQPGVVPGQAKDDSGRYVDEKGMPLGAGATAPPEFKRMPVFLNLLIDQREISRLLVECANSPLPIEVRQVRVSPAEQSTTPAGGRQPHNQGLNMGGSGGPNGGRPRPFAAKNSDEERDKNPYDVIVEISGIIYIFNPPDQAKLAPVGEAAGETPASESAGADAAEGDTAPAGATDAAATEAPAAAEVPAGGTPEGAAGAGDDADEPAADTPASAKKPAAGKKPTEEESTEDQPTEMDQEEARS